MKTLAIIALILTSLFLAGNTHAVTLNEANSAFAAGQYQTSTQEYETLLAQNGYSAPVLFDLGNSYYREGNIAHAILAYRRAQVLSPSDADIAANLQAAQKQAGFATSAPRLSDQMIHVLSASEWAWLGCAAWTLLCLTLLARAFVPQRRGMFSFVAFVDTVVLLAAIAGAVLSSNGLKEVIVTDKNVAVVISPFPAAQTVFSPAPGETLTIRESFNDFYRVTDEAGHEGWISKTQVTPIVPS